MHEPERNRERIASELRRQAEALLAARKPGQRTPVAEDLPNLLHELEVHQIELEMQNEELRGAQGDLERSRNRYADLYDFAPVGYVTLDGEGTIREINLTAAAMLGMERGLLGGKPLGLFLTVFGQSAFAAFRKRCKELDPGEVASMDIALQPARGGPRRPVQLQVAAVRDRDSDEVVYRTVITDLSQLRQTQEALKASHRRLSDVLESIADAFFSCDRQWRFVYVNDQACRMFGRPREELRGSRVSAAFPGGRESPFFAVFDETMRTGKPAEIEAEYYPPLETWFACRCYPSLEGITAYFHDVTARVQAEHELQELNSTLEAQVAARTALAEERTRQLRRMAAELSEAEQRERNRLSRVLHDELQQLLLAARLRLATADRNTNTPDGIQIKAADQLLAECMALSRRLTIELSPPILERGTTLAVFEWLGEWFEERYQLEVRVQCRSPLPPVPQHIRVFLFHAARELLMNTVKHSGANEAALFLDQEDGCLVLEVEDAGSGFDAAAVVEQVDKAQSLGLFHIRERAEAMEGRLEIEATPSGGARFRLLLPHAADGSQEAEPDERSAAGPSAESGEADRELVRILVADDHRIVREGMLMALEAQCGLHVVGEAADGMQAVQQAERLHPQVIVMDIGMPDMDGIEATRRIKQRQPEVRIVGLTMYEEEAIARSMIDAGADACLVKHRPVSELAETIRRLVVAP